MQNSQSFGNGDRHSWFNFVLGYSDRFVGRFIEDFGIKNSDRVLDPFCGTGTTLVECTRRSITSVGIDASPFSCFVSRVKTHGPYNLGRIARTFHSVQENYESAFRTGASWKTDPTYIYVKKSGMLDRHWISLRPLKRAIVLKELISEHAEDTPTRDLLLLCLTSLISSTFGNMRFGPEIYRGPIKADVDPMPALRRVVREAIADIAFSSVYTSGEVRVLRGDARKCADVLRKARQESVDYIITSPPYPTEHDYTRNTRLELALLGFVKDADQLRSIKNLMIRSHTKNLYATDEDHLEVSNNRRLKLLSARIGVAGRDKTSGFARLYPRIVLHYFGGMKRHLESALVVLKEGGRYAMLVGDQASYNRVPIPTGDILRDIAQELGFRVVSNRVWRHRWATNGSQKLAERVLILEKPKSKVRRGKNPRS